MKMADAIRTFRQQQSDTRFFRFAIAGSLLLNAAFGFALVMQPAITVIKTPAAEFRCQRLLAPLDRRLLAHPALQQSAALIVGGQCQQPLRLLRRKEASRQASRLQRPQRPLQIDADRRGESEASRSARC